MMKNNKRMLMGTQIIMILLSVIEVTGILPREEIAGMIAACGVWGIVILCKNDKKNHSNCANGMYRDGMYHRNGFGGSK